MVTFYVSSAFAANNSCSHIASGESPRGKIVIDKMMREDFQDTQRLANQIAKIAPMASHEFVMVGRSPTMLAAYFEAQSYIFRMQMETWTLPIALKNANEISRVKLADRFTKVFELFSPHTEFATKPLVVIDAVEVGRTFISLDRLLAHSGKRALLIGFSDDVPTVEAALRQAHLVNPWKIVPVSHRYMQHLSEHKEAAQFPSYAIDKVDDPLTELKAPPTANSFYRELIIAIEKELGFRD